MAKMGNFSATGMKKLQKQLNKIQQDNVEAFIDACAKELAARLLAEVIQRTPVGHKPTFDGKKTIKVKGASGKTRTFLSSEYVAYKQAWDGYSGGTLRRGWTSKTQEEAEAGVNTKAKDYANSLTINHIGNMLNIEIVNPVEYASYVEYGHRQNPGRYVPALGKQLKKGWFKGRFMLTNSEKEIQEIAPQVLESKIKKFMGDCFK